MSDDKYNKRPTRGRASSDSNQDEYEDATQPQIPAQNVVTDGVIDDSLSEDSYDSSEEDSLYNLYEICLPREPSNEEVDDITDYVYNQMINQMNEEYEESTVEDPKLFIASSPEFQEIDNVWHLVFTFGILRDYDANLSSSDNRIRDISIIDSITLILLSKLNAEFRERGLTFSLPQSSPHPHI